MEMMVIVNMAPVWKVNKQTDAGCNWSDEPWVWEIRKIDITLKPECTIFYKANIWPTIWNLLSEERWYRNWFERTKNCFVVALTPAQLSPLVTFELNINVQRIFSQYFYGFLQESFFSTWYVFDIEPYTNTTNSNSLSIVIVSYVFLWFWHLYFLSNKWLHEGNPEHTHTHSRHCWKYLFCIFFCNCSILALCCVGPPQTCVC